MSQASQFALEIDNCHVLRNWNFSIHAESEIDVSSGRVRAFPGWVIFASPTVEGWWPIIGFADTVRLKDGTLLKIWNEQGSERGTALVQGFAKEQYPGG